MKKELTMTVIGAEEERFSADIYESTLALWTRMNRYGATFLKFTPADIKASNDHFHKQLKLIGQRMHGSYLPAAAHERVLHKPYCFHVDSLIGRYHVWFTTQLHGKRVQTAGLRIVSVPSPYGRYYIGVDNSDIAKRMFGKPSVMIIKSHCITRLQQRLGLNEDDALAHVFHSLISRASMIPDIGEKSIPFGNNDGTIKAKTADVTIDEGHKLIDLKSFFMTICYTYYYPEWEEQ